MEIASFSHSNYSNDRRVWFCVDYSRKTNATTAYETCSWIEQPLIRHASGPSSLPPVKHTLADFYWVESQIPTWEESTLAFGPSLMKTDSTQGRNNSIINAGAGGPVAQNAGQVCDDQPRSMSFLSISHEPGSLYVNWRSRLWLQLQTSLCRHRAPFPPTPLFPSGANSPPGTQAEKKALFPLARVQRRVCH